MLMISTLAGCFAACQGSSDPTDTDPSTEGQTPGGTAPDGTVGETDAETTPPVIREDYIAPEGADVTDLSVSGTVAGSGGSTARTATYTRRIGIDLQLCELLVSEQLVLHGCAHCGM